MNVAVQFHDVTKSFTLRHNQPRTLQETMIHFLRPRRVKRQTEHFWALKNVSFEIERGQTVGLIGPNGSGKSTALKLVAGILHPTSGHLVINGRVSALLELGTGMHPDLTGRENIFLNGSLLGISNAEMAKLYRGIVDFAELEHFIDTPVKHYSSGMYMRLGFSVAIHTQPDILIVDEVLAVGDQAFQAKCLERIYGLKRQGTTIIFVSHDSESLSRICNEVIWLQNGEVQEIGQTEEVLERYLNRMYYTPEQERVPERSHGVINDGRRFGTGEIEILGVRFLDKDREMSRSFNTGEPMTIEMEYEAYTPVRNPVFGLAIHHANGTHINGPNSRVAGLSFDELHGRGVIRYCVEALPLLPATYDVTVAVHDESGVRPFDVHVRAYSFHVHAGDCEEVYGLFYMPSAWEHVSAATVPSTSAFPTKVSK